VKLHRVRQPEATPVVIERYLKGLILLIDVLGEQVLDSSVFCKRDVRTLIEQEVVLVSKRSRMPTVVRVLVIHNGPNIFTVEMTGGPESRHTRPENNDILHPTKLSNEVMVIDTKSLPPPLTAVPLRQ